MTTANVSSHVILVRTPSWDGVTEFYSYVESLVTALNPWRDMLVAGGTAWIWTGDRYQHGKAAEILIPDPHSSERLAIEVWGDVPHPPDVLDAALVKLVAATLGRDAVIPDRDP